MDQNIATEDKNVCINCQKQLEILSKQKQLSKEEFALLGRPKRVLTLNIPLKRDDGRVEFLNAYRVQYNDALGPTKGGIRFHPGVNLEEINTLAFLMALKCSVANLPFGGAKGGVEVDPKELSQSELERLSRAYIKEIHPFIGPNKDIPAPDVNTDPQIMAWMADEYGKIKGKFVPAVITGKPVEIGGSEGRLMATGLGGAFVLERFLERKEPDFGVVRVAIQGFGNVGSFMAKFLKERGFRIVAVSDSKGGVFNKKGLDVERILSKKVGQGISIPETKEGEQISNEELLELETDILIPAALSHQITKENASKVKAKIILEMANAPIDPEADSILLDRDVTVIPDIVANSGGVIVSYFEWVQNFTNQYWSEREVFERLETKIKECLDNVINESEDGNYDLRNAAFALAIRKIIEAEKLRGNL